MSLLLVVVVHLVVVVLVSLFLYSFQPNTTSKILAKAFKAAEQSPYFVTVYDNSTATVVDKLLLVEPYGWILWNFDGRLFVVDSEVGTATDACPRGVGVVQVSPGVNLTFNRKCLNTKLVDLIAFYESSASKRVVPLEPKKVYTILDCIEALSNGIVYIKTDGDRNRAEAAQFDAQSVYDTLYRNASIQET